MKPKAILRVLLPVILIIPRANRASQPCFTIATASMSEPIIKKTASFMKACATRLGVSILKYDRAIIMKMAVAGNGIGSATTRIKVTITITITRCPAMDRPSGVGKIKRIIPVITAMSSQRIRVIQNSSVRSEFKTAYLICRFGADGGYPRIAPSTTDRSSAGHD